MARMLADPSCVARPTGEPHLAEDRVRSAARPRPGVRALKRYYHPGRDPDDDEIAFFGAMADQAAVAVTVTAAFWAVRERLVTL
jgi:hypothetical protein